MRTTVTLDPDVEAQLAKLMRERGIGFKQAINSVLRAALRPPAEQLPSYTTPVAMGKPLLPLEHALRVAAEIEDEELVRKLRIGK